MKNPVSLGVVTGLSTKLSERYSLLGELGATRNFSIASQDASPHPTSWTLLEGLGISYTKSDQGNGYQLSLTVEFTQESNSGPASMFLLVGAGLGRATFESLYATPVGH